MQLNRVSDKVVQCLMVAWVEDKMQSLLRLSVCTGAASELRRIQNLAWVGRESSDVLTLYPSLLAYVASFTAMKSLSTFGHESHTKLALYSN